MTNFKRKFMTDKLLEILEYAAVRVSIEDVMGEYISMGHVKVDDTIIRVTHKDTGFEVYSFERYDVQTIQYDMTTDHATIRLNMEN